MIKVSLILPVYNVEEYLRQCLDSIVNQTLKDIEIICINDGSNDNSLKILNEYAAKDKRFVIISQENQGQGVARNKGIDIAKGEYIQFVDPDDWIELDALETLYNLAKLKNSQIIRFNYRIYNDYSGEFQTCKLLEYFKKSYNYDLTLHDFYSWKDLDCKGFSDLEIFSPMYFYSADFIRTNNIKYGVGRLGEDLIFVVSSILLADRIDYLNKYYYYYRIRQSSSVFSKSDNNFSIFDNLLSVKQFLIENNFNEELNKYWLKFAQKHIAARYYLIPDNSIKRFEEISLNYFNSVRELKKTARRKRRNRKFIEEIFSIKGEMIGAIKYKAVCILGFVFYIKPAPKSKLTYN